LSAVGTLDNNARLFHSLRADKLVMNQDRISHLQAAALAADGVTPTGVNVTLRARHFVVAASAIGSPGLLLRSYIPDPHQRIGKGSFIHPVNATVAQMPQQVDPFYGAPQSVYSDEFNFRNGFGEHHHVRNLSIHDASIFPTGTVDQP